MLVTSKKLLLPFAFACCSACLRRTSRIRYFGSGGYRRNKYNGKYYIGGVPYKQDFYVSDDLVHWETYPCRIHGQWQLDQRQRSRGDDQIHANDMFYLDDFHCTGQSIIGERTSMPFTLYAPEQRCLGRLYRTEQRRHGWITVSTPKYSEMMMDNYTCIWYVLLMGNTIWGRKMKNPAEFAGEPVCQFASTADT